MIALYIILGILAVLTLILSINFIVVLDYDEVLKMHGKWLFWEVPIFPSKKKEKKPKKMKKSAKKPEAETGPEAAQAENESGSETELEQETEIETKTKVTDVSEKKPDKKKVSKTKKAKNPFEIFYENTGFDGVMNLIHKTIDALGGMFKGLMRHLVVRELFIDLTVTGRDAADTALRYGKVCQKVFPALGYICSNMKVRKYDLEINPDFLGGKDKAEYHLVFSMKPLFLIWFLLVVALRLIFQVALKFLIKSRPEKQKVKTQKK